MDGYPSSDGPMPRITEGMDVIDSDGTKVGTVEEVRMGDPEAVEAEPAAADDPSVTVPPLAAVYLDGSGLHPDARARLARTGFVRVDAKGLFAGDRYVEPDQIADVSDDRGRLSVPRDQLLG